MDTDQPTLWDAVEGVKQRDEAMTRVLNHTPASYRIAFNAQVRDFAAERRDFTSEDITARVGQPPPPTHPNAVGALTRAAALRFGAMKVGRTKAQRSNQHATEIAVWGWR